MPSSSPTFAQLALRLLGPATLTLAVACSPGVDAGPAELTETARHLQAYLRLETVNPPGNEGLAVDFLAGLLHREGIETLRLISPEGRPSLYARVKSGRPDADALVLMHHMDVVPAGPGWSVDPFGGEVRDDRLWGRGALDIKSLGLAQLEAFVDLHRRMKAGEELVRDVVYLAVADEERGGGQGTRFVLERHGDLLGPIYAVINEGGSNRTVNGRSLWTGIEISQKRPLWLRGGRCPVARSIRARCVPATSSLPCPANAPMDIASWRLPSRGERRLWSSPRSWRPSGWVSSRAEM